MSVWSYVRGHLASLVIAVLTCAALWAMLRLVGQGADLAALLTMVVALAFAVSGFANYLHERSLYCRLLPIVSGGSDALGLAAELRNPGTPLGDIACEAIRTVRIQAQAQVGEAHAREHDHREFVEAWVHEVKTPLAAAELMVENLGDSRLRPLSHELDRVTAYVEQALFYARSSSVENDYLVRSCMLANLVGDAAKDRASATVRAGMALGMEGLDLQVFTDLKWIKFVLGQIIDNAVRYRRPSGARIDFVGHVEGAGSADERVVLDVRDNGCGISAADIGRVFDKGFTGENGRAFARSTGIGLYLVRTLCEKMGLSVSIASVEGVWTCVSISFPTNRMRLIAD